MHQKPVRKATGGKECKDEERNKNFDEKEGRTRGTCRVPRCYVDNGKHFYISFISLMKDGKTVST
jgi:hypothetical protein